MVTAPFNNTVAPVSSWARFALANGFNRTSSAVYGSCESACSADQKFLQPVRDVTRDMSMHFRKPEFH